MPGPQGLTPGPGNRRRVRLWAVPVALLLAVTAAWGATRVVAATNRHRMPHPTRALPSPQEEAAFELGFAPEHLRQLLADGASEGIAPNGNRVVLTLDDRLQKAMFDLFRHYDPDYGVFAAMEPATGRVLALVGYRRGGEADPWLPLKAIYPAASLFKVVTAAAAIEKGNVEPDDEISYRGGIYRITRRGLHVRDGRGVPAMTLEEAIARSANAVFGKVTVNSVGSEGLREYMERFGFGQPIPFALPVEPSRGEIPRDEFNLARTGAGFGEVYVSPLHMAMIMSAVGDNGAMPVPYLIDRVEDNDGDVLYEGSHAKWRDTVKPETAKALLDMMVKTIEMGTSRRTFGTPASTPLLQDMTVAGKTGSLSGWTPRRHFEWFAGVAPVSEPKLAVVALVVNDGKWRIKGSYVGKEAFNCYFGYPSSDPPVYAKGRKARKVRKHARKRGRKRTHAAKTSGTGGVPATSRKKPMKPAPKTSALPSFRRLACLPLRGAPGRG